jgi:hypothetical protein
VYACMSCVQVMAGLAADGEGGGIGARYSIEGE